MKKKEIGVILYAIDVCGHVGEKVHCSPGSWYVVLHMIPIGTYNRWYWSRVGEDWCGGEGYRVQGPEADSELGRTESSGTILENQTRF